MAFLPWRLPAFVGEMPMPLLRWAAAAVGLACLGLSVHCWLRMGRNWRMAVAPDQQTELVTTGLYGLVRHPIYALSILLIALSPAIRRRFTWRRPDAQQPDAAGAAR